MEAAAKAHLASGRAAAAVRALLRRGPGGALAAAEVALAARVRGAPEKHTGRSLTLKL
jgi:gem associated protein 5